MKIDFDKYTINIYNPILLICVIYMIGLTFSEVWKELIYFGLFMIELLIIGLIIWVFIKLLHGLR